MKTIQKGILKNMINKSERNPKMFQGSHGKTRKEKVKNHNQKNEIKRK